MAGAPRKRNGAAVVVAVIAMTAAHVLAMAVAISAHDPGLSALDVTVDATPRRIIARLSLAAADARAFAGERAEDLERAAAESVEVSIDGVRLTGRATRQPVHGNGEETIVLTFDGVRGARMIVRSDVARRVALGHRQLATVRESSGKVLVERMLDAGNDRLGTRIEDDDGFRRVRPHFLWLGAVVAVASLLAARRSRSGSPQSERRTASSGQRTARREPQ